MSSTTIIIFIIAAIPTCIALFFYIRQLGNGASKDPATHEQRTSDEEASRLALDRIDSAHSITLKKVLMPLVAEEWDVLIDREHIGKITGLLINILGETFSLHDDSGNLLGSIEEKAKILSSRSSIYDYNNKNVGALE